MPTGLLPSAVVTGDFNGDGKLDWVVANAGDNTLNLYLGNGDGTAQPPVIIPLVGQSPVGLAAADLNGDGKLDLVVAESDSQTVGILFGNGDGTFQPEVELPAFPVQTLAVAVADVNKDGHPDLVIGIAGNSGTVAAGRFAVLLNDGKGNFGAPIYAPNSPSLQFPSGQELSVADVNNDGVPDILVTGNDDNGGSTQIFLGNGDGTFTAGQVLDVSQSGIVPRFVQNAALADVNGDGCPDAIVVDSDTEASIYLGDCKGDFDTTSALVYGMGDNPYGLAVADLNGDGHPDLVIGGVPLPQDTLAYAGDVTGDTIGVRLNDGTGHFGPLRVYRGDPGIFSLAVADLAGNGHPDILTANQNANTATVYLNDGSGGFGEPEGGYDGEYEGSINGFFNPPESGFLATDVNGDGLPDLTLIESEDASTNLYQVTVMLNQGNGLFGPPVRTPAFRSDYIVNDFTFAKFRTSAQEDFLGIAFDDSGNCGQPELIYAQNTGNGTFGAPVQIPITLSSTCFAFPILAIGDFNGDGKLDFVVASPTGPSGSPLQLTVYLGNGDGTFQPPRQMNFALPQGVNTSPEAIFVEDANGDGKEDVLVWDGDNVYGPPPTGKDLLEFLGNGDGTFQAPKDVIQSLYAMTMRDLNGDGRLDVIDIASGSAYESEYTPGTAPALVSIYLGQPDGSFSLAHTYSPFEGTVDTFFGNTASQAPNDQIIRPYIGDFNGDGNTDIAIFQRQNDLGNGYAQFLVGNGDGSFSPAFDIYPLGIEYAPDTAAENLFGDGHAAFIQAPNYAASYHIMPSNAAPFFQIQPDEIPVLNEQGDLDISLNVASSSDTTVSLSASDPNVQVPPSAVIPAGNLSVQVPFTLSSSNAQSRWFSITAQSNGESQTVYDFPVPLGVNPFTLLVAPPPVNTVEPGGTSQLWAANIQVTGDASGTFQISCSNLPPGFSCQFIDGVSSVTVESGAFSGSDFSVSAGSSVAYGQYSFNVVAANAATTLAVPVTITVPSPPPPVPGISISPVSYAFPAVLVGATQTEAFNVYNPGTAALDISGINIQSGTNGTFAQSNNCGTSLAPSSSCTITVTFTAISVGTASGTMTVSDNAAGSPQAVSLSATVGDFSLQPSSGAATTISVDPGTTATFSLQVTGNNLDIGVGLTCTGSILEGTCAVQPASVNVNPPSSTPFQVTVSSTAPSGSVLVPRRPSLWDTRTLCLSLLLLVLVLLLFNNKYAARPVVRMRPGFLVLWLLASAIAIASCGGGGGSNSSTGSGLGGNPGTAAGTYNFTVTGTSGGVSRTLQLTVVVK